MFRLESYITPIILNYVAKYVKNVRPQDAQVSLWEGEVAFQNLDLRLDVLEQEINLPFEFLSGHIHELIIHVPWTKINSEPINITINTIEFVLKLKDQNDRDAASSPTNPSSPQKTDRKKKISRIEESQPGFNSPGLVNKIINNITVNCHNIILKYVEEDIVVSMNVQLLSLHSTDENWKPAFFDIHPLKSLLRKVIQVSDLTICLDKRNSMGQIEVCQEPILYKCSLQIRFILKSFNKIKETRLAILTNNVEMNVSSLQFPMAIRLINLMLALKSGNLKINSDIEDLSDANDELNVSNENSWTTVLWNMIPTFSFNEEEQETKMAESIENVSEIGLYVENFKFTLKSSEFINESIVGTTKKIRYNPIVALYCYGIYSETVMNDRIGWFSYKSGVSKIVLEPLGFFQDELSEKYLVKSDCKFTGKHIYESLFDDNSQIQDPICTINEYLKKNSNEYLNYRAPCLNLDITKYRKPSDETSIEPVVEDVVYRLLISSVSVLYNTASKKIIDTITDLFAQYDYPPYLSETTDKDVKLSPPLLEDYDSLMMEVPVKTISFLVQNMTFKIFSQDELYVKSQNRTKIIQKLPKKAKAKLPYFTLKVNSLSGKYLIPQDPELLVHTTCQLPKQPVELLNACYEQLYLNANDISIDICDRNATNQILHIPTANCEVHKMLFPQLWHNEQMAELKVDIVLQKIMLNLTKPRFILMSKMINTINKFDHETINSILESSTRIDMHNLHLYEMENIGKNLSLNFMIFRQTFATRGSLEKLTSNIVANGFNKVMLLESNETFANTAAKNINWIEWSIQLPKNFENNDYSMFLCMNVQPYTIFLNKYFADFLQYRETKIHFDRDASPERESKYGSERNLERKSAKKSFTTSSRKISQPEETILLSSEKDEITEHAKNKKITRESMDCRKMFHILKYSILNININSGAVYFLNESTTINNFDFETTTIWTPNIVFKSSSENDLVKKFSFPIKSISHQQESFPWTCDISSFSINSKTKCGTVYPILHPIQTKITVAMNHKIEMIPVTNTIFLKAVDQIKERSDKKTLYTYEDNAKKKRELHESDVAEEVDLQSIKCEWSTKEIQIDALNRKNPNEKDKNNDEYNLLLTAPSTSPRRLDHYEAKELDPVKATETQTVKKDNIAVNFHIDTSPILFEMRSDQAELLQCKIDTLFTYFKLFGLIGGNSKTSLNFATTESLDEETTIKEFLEMDTCSECSSRVQSNNDDCLVISTWLQWTVAKVGCKIEASAECKTKLVIEIEDFIISLDKQSDYLKVKSKLGTISMCHYEENEHKEARVNDNIKFNIKKNNSELPFIDMTVTIADTKSVFKKIGAHKKADLNNQLYEVIVLMQAFETTLDFEKLFEFMPIILLLKNNCGSKTYETMPKTKQSQNSVPGSQLPLIYFDLNGFTVYSPVKISPNNYKVFIINFNEIKLSPNVKNPLTRKPLRSDMYNKAAQMGLLNIRGSVIEDRQYELIFNKISVATGNWNDLLTHVKDYENNLRNANPAFEWNHQNHQAKTPLQLQEIFNSFVICTTYAPAIFYHKILVCGQSVEFNCVSDLNAKVSTEQIKLISCIAQIMATLRLVKKSATSAILDKYKGNANVKRKINSKESDKMSIKRLASNTSVCSADSRSKKNNINPDVNEERYTDSGISTYEKAKRRYNHRQQNKSTKIETLKKVPFEFSFFAGVFTIEIYHTIDEESVLGEKKTSLLLPLFMWKISQPSLLICMKKNESFVQCSLHNLTINLSKLSTEETEENLFPTNIFDTLPGKLDISGIPPSLFSLKIHYDKAQRCEIRSSFSKPIKIHAQHKIVQKIMNIWIALNEATGMIGPVKQSPLEITRGSKIKLLKKRMINADVIKFNLNQLIIKSEEPEQYEIELILNHFKSDIIFQNRPEKSQISCTTESFYVKTENKVCLHPLSFNFKLDLVKEKWCSVPLLNAKIRLNVVQVDIGIKNLQNILSAAKAFGESVGQAQKVLQRLQAKTNPLSGDNFLSMQELILPENVMELPLPKVVQNDEFRNKEEFYQDDLRAGAFQFIEICDDSSLPLPYQIHIITKNHGIICWRYPQPRQICRLHVFPIPMPVANPIDIECKIEYYNELHQKFLTFCEFSLSETRSVEIDLPKRNITANIWRVNILQPLVSINREYFETSEEDDEVKLIKFEDLDLSEDNNFTLHPKVLVGCMKIDTYFNQQHIPKIEVLLDVEFCEVNLQNQQETQNGMTHDFQHLKISNEFSQVETFFTFSLKNAKIFGKFYTPQNFCVDSEVCFSAKILDYGMANMQFLVEETNLQNYFVFENDLTLFNLICDTIKINMDPGILHTFVTSYRQWSQRIESVAAAYDPIVTRFVVANITQNRIVFGQTDTHERIHIDSQECVMYSFVSDVHDLSLTFYNAQNLSDFSEKIILKLEDSVDFIQISDTIYTIETKKISTTQIIVYLKGQIEFLLKIDENFKIQFRSQDRDGVFTNKSPEYKLNGGRNISFCHNVSRESATSVRIKFDSNQARLWSGDIPLRANKNLPWLVKVPVSRANDFISFWFRIVIEEISKFKTSTLTPLRILIMVWPIYQIKSMFPLTTSVFESSTKTEMQVEGRGNVLELKLPATHETEHVVTFTEKISADEQIQSACNLSLKTIDWNQFFYYDEKKWTIAKCLKDLQDPTEIMWPYNNEQELKIWRKCSENVCVGKPMFKIYPSTEFSCTLLLESTPWCIFINSLSCTIRLQCITTQKNVEIASNELTNLFAVSRGFTIEVNCSLGWVKSLPIDLEERSYNDNKTKKTILLKESDEIELIFSGPVTSKAILKSIIENGRRILVLRPNFVLINYSNENFFIIPFCLEYNRKVTRKEVKMITEGHGVLVRREEANNAQNVCGIAIDTFYNLSAKSDNKNSQLYHFCISFYADRHNDTTVPIYLSKVFNRRCLSLQTGNASIALSVNCLEHEGQYYISVFDDSLPMLEIHNWTDLNFMIAQMNADAAVQPECEGYNFEWHQILNRVSTLFYTPPEAYMNFPDNSNVMCNIALAFYNEESLNDTKSFRWSRPLRTNLSCEKFFNIPMFGDVKITVCDKHKTTKIFITYIAEQLEFSVKDLRSRLISPSTNVHQDKAKVFHSEQKSYVHSGRLPATPDFSRKKCNHDVQSKAHAVKCREIILYVKEVVLCLSKISDKSSILNKSEILAIYMDDMIVKYEKDNRSIDWIASNVQIDNQLFASCKYDFSVILSAQEIYNRTSLLPCIYELRTDVNAFADNPLIKLNLKLRSDCGSFEVNSVCCKIKPIRTYIEDTYLNDLLSFVTDCSIENLVFSAKKKINKRVLDRGQTLIPEQIRNRAIYLAEPIKLELFRIEPLSVMFSVHTCIRFYIALDHSPLELAAFERRNITTLPVRLGYIVGVHYLSGALFGAGWVLGSLEILGSPSGLARCFTIGFRDFVTLPLEGFFRGPWGFVMGITHGSVSLLRNITAGTVNSVTKLASSVARNIDRLTFDEEHFQRTELIRRIKPQGFAEGLSQGLTSLGINMLGAVGGLARHPLEAQSPVQIVTGVGKGIVGAIAKPLSGAAELVALTGQGVLHTVGFNTQPLQRSAAIEYRHTNRSPANSKIWKLLPKVLQFDQILFFHEATLVVGQKLKPAMICVTSTVLAILEMNTNELAYVIPVERVIASFDESDRTLININLKPKDELVDEFINKQFVRSRIMDFLRSSRNSETSRMSVDSLEDLLVDEKLGTKLDWSFYISENLGNHLLQYLKILTPYPRV